MTGVTEPTVSTTPGETTVTTGDATVQPGQGGAEASAGTGGTGNSPAGATLPLIPQGQIADGTAAGATQTASLPQTIRSIRIVRPVESNRELTQVVAEIGDTSRGFRFALPDRVTRDAHGSIAEMANGEKLPAWLIYHPEDFSFTATAVPARGLPVSVIVTTVRPDGTTHRISISIRP